MQNSNIEIILGSSSPRRAMLLKELDYTFTQRALKTDESFPKDLGATKIAQYLARKKAENYQFEHKKQLLITADTTVVLGEKVLNKPHSEQEAIEMLQMLAAKTHQVISAVCLRSTKKTTSFQVSTEVEFLPLTQTQIKYYIQHYKPFDKAGAYGIQEWIGHVAVKEIRGSYTNVVGLPTLQTHEAIQHFISHHF